MEKTKMFDALKQSDPEIFSEIQNETRRQDLGLEMIASENYVSKAVLEAQGSILTNKYAEGIPGRRYYRGCEYIDVIERLARKRAKQLFGRSEERRVGKECRSRWSPYP